MSKCHIVGDNVSRLKWYIIVSDSFRHASYRDSDVNDDGPDMVITLLSFVFEEWDSEWGVHMSL